MRHTTLDDAAARYIDAVRAELSDVPADEIAEITEDVSDHLRQVSAGQLFPRPQVELDPITGECVEVEIATPFGAALPGTPSLDDADVVPDG